VVKLIVVTDQLPEFFDPGQSPLNWPNTHALILPVARPSPGKPRTTYLPLAWQP